MLMQPSKVVLKQWRKLMPLEFNDLEDNRHFDQTPEEFNPRELVEEAISKAELEEILDQI